MYGEGQPERSRNCILRLMTLSSKILDAYTSHNNQKRVMSAMPLPDEFEQQLRDALAHLHDPALGLGILQHPPRSSEYHRYAPSRWEHLLHPFRPYSYISSIRLMHYLPSQA